MKEKKVIEVFYFDGSYDVEVYNWIEELNKNGMRNEELTEFGVETREEVDACIDLMKERFDVTSVRFLKGDDEELSHVYGEVNEDFVWTMIDQSVSLGDVEKQRKWLITVLSQMGNEAIDAFEKCFDDIRSEIRYHSNFMRVYRLAGVWGGDDSIDYFVGRVMALGQVAAKSVLRDPYEIERYDVHGDSGELFLYVADYARDEKSKQM